MLFRHGDVLIEKVTAIPKGAKRLKHRTLAHGELTGILMIRAYHESKGRPRRIVLVPDSAHGTNPASVTISGYEVQKIPSTEQGTVDLARLKEVVNDEVAAIMITNPNTLGIFEGEIAEVCDVLHAAGALVYMDFVVGESSAARESIVPSDSVVMACSVE